MQKKNLVLAISSIALMGFLTAATATSAHSKLTPFTDTLTVHFDNFPTDTIMTADYADNNGVNISGPMVINTNGDAIVTIHSDNKVENGYPAMTLDYAAGQCALNFVDGPLRPLLAFESGIPSCPDVTVGNIEETGLPGSHTYALNITSY